MKDIYFYDFNSLSPQMIFIFMHDKENVKPITSKNVKSINKEKL